MGYKQSPGRKNMPKTGRGIDAATLMTGSPAMQQGKKLFDADGDGDTVFNDSNKDGTMLSRAIQAFSDGSKRSDEKAARAKSYQKSIDRRFVQDIKDDGLLTAIKRNFKF